jgi:hypothetical protein
MIKGSGIDKVEIAFDTTWLIEEECRPLALVPCRLTRRQNQVGKDLV